MVVLLWARMELERQGRQEFGTGGALELRAVRGAGGGRLPDQC